MELYRESTDLSLLQVLSLFFGVTQVLQLLDPYCVPTRGLTAFTFIGVRGG